MNKVSEGEIALDPTRTNRWTAKFTSKQRDNKNKFF